MFYLPNEQKKLWNKHEDSRMVGTMGFEASFADSMLK